MVSRKPSLSQAETVTEDERSSKGGFFANWFNAATRTESRDETDYSDDSVGSDSIEDQYPSNSRRGKRIPQTRIASLTLTAIYVLVMVRHANT